MSNNTCDDYKCEGGQDHTHIGTQPHLRRVIDHGKLVDGATREAPVEEVEVNEG